MKKKALFFSMLFVGALIAAPNAAQAYEPPVNEFGTPITIHIDGEYLPCDVDPIMQNNRVLMPMRAAGEALGATVNWDQPTQTATLTKNGNTIQFTAGSSTYYINGAANTTDVPPQVIQGRTLIPLRAFAEALNTRVDWLQAQLDVSISATGEPASLPQIPLDVTNEVAGWLQKYYTNEANGIFGNWHRSYFYYGAYLDEYEFFYTSPSGYQNIEITVEKSSIVSTPVITILKNDTWLTNTGYRRANFQNIIYYKGPGRGWTGYSENDYQMSGDNLVHTGTQVYAMGSGAPESYQSAYDVYTRF